MVGYQIPPQKNTTLKAVILWFYFIQYSCRKSSEVEICSYSLQSLQSSTWRNRWIHWQHFLLSLKGNQSFLQKIGCEWNKHIHIYRWIVKCKKLRAGGSVLLVRPQQNNLFRVEAVVFSFKTYITDHSSSF